MKEQLTVPKRFKELANKFYKSNKQFKEYKRTYEEEKEKLTSELIDFLDRFELDKLDFEVSTLSNNCIVRVSKRTKTTINYDVSKIVSKVDKELCNSFIDKEYHIDDINGLVKYLKTCNVDAKKFKSFIRVEETVNKNKLEQLFQLGDITTEDLKGCYSFKQSKPYIDVKVSEK